MHGKSCYQGLTSHLWTYCWNRPNPVCHIDHQASCPSMPGTAASLPCVPAAFNLSSALTNKNPDKICRHKKADVSLHNHLNPPASHHLLFILFPSAFLHTHVLKTNYRYLFTKHKSPTHLNSKS